MITPHPEIDESALTRLLLTSWDLDARHFEFLPVGGDSWSYRVGDRFVNVRDSRGQRKAYSVARDVAGSIDVAVALKERCGLGFILSPDHTLSGAPSARIGTWLVTVFPFLEGVMSWEVKRPDVDERVRGWVERIHAASSDVADLPLPHETFGADYAGALTEAIDRAATRTDDPYADRLATTLSFERELILSALQAHRSHGADLRARDLEFVVTHGEPAGNVLILPDDTAYLIDLVDLRRAPRERDFVDLSEPNVDAEIIDYYRRDYALSEITEYADRLSRPHIGDAEDERAWHELGVFIDALR